MVELGNGWRLLVEGEPLRPGDGFQHPDIPDTWIDYACRPDIFRGCGKEGEWYYVPQRDFAHTWPWRRRLDNTEADNDGR
jgi:hypothetical protein